MAAGPAAKRPPHNLFVSFGTGLFGALASVLLFAVATTAAADEEKLSIGEFIPASPAQPAPEVGFTDMDGKPVNFADLKGKPVVVNLWATWCQPCLREMPSLERLQSKLEGKLVVAAISEDRGGAKLVAPFVAAHDIKSVKLYLDPKSDVGHALKTRGLPTSVILNADGQIVGKVEGAAEWDSAKMLEVLQPLVAAAPK